MPGYAYPSVGLLRLETAIALLCALALGAFALVALAVVLRGTRPRLRAALAAILPPGVFALLALFLAQAAWAAAGNAGLPVPLTGYAQPLQDADLLLPLMAALVALTVCAIWSGVSQLSVLRRDPRTA